MRSYDQEVMTMYTNTHILEKYKAITLYPLWISIKDRVKRTLTRELMADIALSTATIAIMGVILFAFFQAVQGFEISSTGFESGGGGYLAWIATKIAVP